MLRSYNPVRLSARGDSLYYLACNEYGKVCCSEDMIAARFFPFCMPSCSDLCLVFLSAACPGFLAAAASLCMQLNWMLLLKSVCLKMKEKYACCVWLSC
ncbi:hypothetical protein DUNSADRAFT_16581 [Dunaliella salina]|uniref:Encoded protein n=1 Tax=Dunaliella salina TaxID=3046 RepID=A0ABQ7H0W0_DUNSA|nr:hypothetical protein DUNSADRAFT_16581 [Dunaliella salina]|eukprot:KAF5840490.1 hypothetical protein DUNSADRAFT_16581 [Dunaliella salina]